MKRFDYFDATSVKDAVSVLGAYENAKVIAGGQDLLTLIKDRIEGPGLKVPAVLVNLKNVPGLVGVVAQNGSVQVGAMTKLSEIETSPVIGEKFGALAQAAHKVGSPPLRNLATIGGNLCQRPRCWYFRDPLFTNCYKRGGDFCYAVTGDNRYYHTILQGELCYAVCHSDTAPALIALGAKAKIAGSDGEKTVPLEEFYIGPREDVMRETILAADQILTEVEVPNPAANTKSVFLKCEVRQRFDFALVSVAVAITTEGGAVKDARIVLGAVAPTPYRATEAEDLLKGKQIDERLAAQAGAAAVAGVRAMGQNEYKVGLTTNLVARAVLQAA